MGKINQRKLKEKALRKFYTKGKDAEYAHLLMKLSPKHVKIFERKFPNLSFTPSIGGNTSIFIKR